jgi:hypothetical protein
MSPSPEPVSTNSASTPSAGVAQFHAASWIGWAAAACFALSTAYFGANYFATRSALAIAASDAEFARIDAQDLTQRLEAERILHSAYIAALQKSGDLTNLKMVKLTATLATSPQAVATALWNPLSQSGLLLLEKLPALPADQDYQLWLTDAAKTAPINSGIIPVDAAGTTPHAFRPDQSVTAATIFTLTREPKGGSSGTPRGPVIATGTL